MKAMIVVAVLAGGCVHTTEPWWPEPAMQQGGFWYESPDAMSQTHQAAAEARLEQLGRDWVSGGYPEPEAATACLEGIVVYELDHDTFRGLFDFGRGISFPADTNVVFVTDVGWTEVVAHEALHVMMYCAGVDGPEDKHHAGGDEYWGGEAGEGLALRYP